MQPYLGVTHHLLSCYDLLCLGEIFSLWLLLLYFYDNELAEVWQCCSQCGPLDVEIISEELIVMLRQLSYAIKNQLKAPKAPY